MHSPGTMKKAYRKLALFISIVVFLTIGPILVLYAMGYRFRLDGSETMPVGVVIVESFPRRASISIDGNLIGNTPKAISNLPPGNLTVTISKPGYKDWQKKVAILPTTITDIPAVRLFPEQINRTTILSDVSAFNISPNRQLIAAIDNRQRLLVTDIDGALVLEPIPLTGATHDVLWSPDSNSLALRQGAAVSIVDITQQDSLPKAASKLPPSQDIIWDQRIPGRLFNLKTNGDLQAYHVVSQLTETIAKDVAAFATSHRQLYIIDRSNNLILADLQGRESVRYSLPPDDQARQILVTPAGRVAIHFESGRVALFTADKALLTIADQADKIGWSPGGQILYVQTDQYSLYVYNVGEERLAYLPLNQLHLVTRLSRPIREPQWFAGGHHLIFQVDDEIIISEIDTRDYPVSYSVDTTNLGNAQVSVGANGESVLYLKNTGPGQRLVAAQLITN